MSSVSVFTLPLQKLSRQQVARYLGIGSASITQDLEAMMEELLPGFLASLQCRGCCLKVPITICDSVIDFGVFRADSVHLSRNLKDCSHAVLFAATLGMGTEQLKRKTAVRSPARALMLDAMGSAAIEVFCDNICAKIASEYAAYRVRPRFSPGYGDFALETQKAMLEALDARRCIGVTLTEGMLMVPQKSVTAIVGLGLKGCERLNGDCSLCEQKDCEFRL